MTDLVTTIKLNRAEVLRDFTESSQSFFNNTIDTSKSSFLTHVNTLLADIASDNQFYNTFLFNEQFLNSAKYRSSVLKRAREVGYYEGGVKPEIVFSNILFKISDSELNDGSVLNFNLNKEEILFTTGNITYSLLGDIKIEKFNGEWNVFLDDNIITGERSQLQSQIISNIPNYDGNYLVFQTFLVQLKIKLSNHIVGFRRDREYYEFDTFTNDNLYNIRIYYIDSSGNKVYLSKLNSFGDIESDLNLPVFVLKEVDENYFSIILDNGNLFKFIPTGTELQIETFETLGKDGRVKSLDFDVINNSPNNRTVLAYTDYESKGGTSKLTLNELKRDIIRFVQTPDIKSVITEFDYRNMISQYTGIPQEDIVTILRRNDPIERVIDVYLKLNSDVHNELIHSNTLNIRLNDLVTDTINGNIPTGTRFKESLDTTTNIKYLVPTDPTDTGASHYYRNINTIKIFSAPTLRYAAYTNEVNDIFQLKETYNASRYRYHKYSVFAKNIGITYDSNTKKYKIFTYLFSNKQDIFDDPASASTITAKVLFSSPNTSRQYMVELINDRSKTNIEYSTYIDTSELYNDSGLLEILSGYSLDSSTGEFVQVSPANVFNIESDLSIEVFIESSDASVIVSSDSSQLVVTDYITTMSSLAKPVLFSKFSVSNIKLFRDLTEVFSSYATSYNVNGADLALIPVIGENDYLDPTKRALVEDFLVKIDVLNKNLLLNKEEPSKLGVKFFNTYGDTEEYLNYTSSNLSLSIELSYDAGRSEATLFDDVKTVIVDFIRSKSGFATVNDKNIYISDIIQEVMNKVTGLIQVRIINITDNLYYQGNIDYKTMSPSQLLYYTPSLLNIRREDITIIVK